MIKIFSFTLFAFLAILTSPSATHAQTRPPTPAIVSGTVMDSAYTSLPGVNVAINCYVDSGTTNSAVATTGSSMPYLGYFEYQFDINTCPNGSPVWVQAVYNDQTGSSTSIMAPFGQIFLSTHHLFIGTNVPEPTPPVPPPQVPEFGLFTGFMTIVSSTGLFFMMRNRVKSV